MDNFQIAVEIRSIVRAVEGRVTVYDRQRLIDLADALEKPSGDVSKAPEDRIPTLPTLFAEPRGPDRRERFALLVKEAIDFFVAAAGEGIMIEVEEGRWISPEETLFEFAATDPLFVDDETGGNYLDLSPRAYKAILEGSEI